MSHSSGDDGGRVENGAGTLRTKVESVLRELSSIKDPARRAVAAHECLHQIDGLRREVSRLRRDAVLELRRAGLSHQSVGELLGVKKGTAQLIAEGRSRGARNQQATNNDDLDG